MMEEEPPLPPPDKSRKRSPERCPRPLYSPDSAQSHHNTHCHYQAGSVIVVKVEVKEEEEDADVRGDDWCAEEISPQIGTDCRAARRNVKADEEEHRRVKIKEEETPMEIRPGGSRKRRCPERCPRLLSSQDSPQQGPHALQHNKAAGLSDIKVKVFESEEIYAEDHSEEEKIPPKISAGGQYTNHGASPPGDGLPPSAASKRPKKFVCSQCGKSFVQRTKLLAHERIHTGERPYSCSECDKVFTQKAHLITHEKTHSDEKPFSCSYCRKCFADKAILARHEKFHSGEKPFACSVCEKGFTMKGDLVKHLRIHTGEKPFSCSNCGKCFLDKARLDRHKLIHTGQKPFSCSFCGKNFALKGFLVMHERTHTHEKPYSCPVCGKRFNQKSNLATHERTHTGEKPFSCSDCGKSFTRKASLNSHQVKPH